MFSRRLFVQTGVTATTLIAAGKQFRVSAESESSESDDQDHGILFHQDLPELPEAEEGEIDVVLVGYADSSNIGILIHNASDETVALEDADGIARSADGAEAESVVRTIFAPYTVEPGGYAIGVMGFDVALDPDENYEFEITAVESDNDGNDRLNFPVVGIEIDRDRVAGPVENTTDVVISERASVLGLFFGEDGNVVGWFQTYLFTDVDPGENGRYTNGHVIGEVTDSWVLAASGPAV